MEKEITIPFTPHDLHAVLWEPDKSQDVVGIIVAIHGLSTHAKREFFYTGPFFTGKKFAILAIDLPGFGHWPGTKGNVKSWRVLRDAVQCAIDAAHDTHPDLPLFLLGVSMGGLVVLEYALTIQKPRPVPIKAIATLVPAIDHALDLKWYHKLLILLIGTVAGNTKYAGKNDPIECHDPNSIVWEDDPLRLQYQRLGFIKKLWGKMRWVQKQASNWNDPLLVITVDQDAQVRTEAVKAWVEQVREKSATTPIPVEYELFEDCYHRITHELRRDEVFNRILEFFRKMP